MKKAVFSFLLIVFTCILVYNQATLRGIVTGKRAGFSSGDSVTIACMKIARGDTTYYVSVNNNLRIIPSGKITVFRNGIDFWDWEWFKNKSYDNAKYGWKTVKRKKLEEQTLNYIASLDQDNRLYDDIFVEDYLLELLREIHPVLFYKGRNQYFSFKLLNSNEEKIYTFDNGTIIISTQTISTCKSEKELMVKIAVSVAHILSDHNLDNINSFTEDQLGLLGVNYSKQDSMDALITVNSFMISRKASGHQVYRTGSDEEFLLKIGRIVSYTAWQEFYSQHYFESLRMVNRLIDAHVASEDDYLLKAKIYRIMSTGDESLVQALNYLVLADSISNTKLIDIYPEMGIVQMKLQQWEAAFNTFSKYREILMNQQISGDELKWCNHMEYVCQLQLYNVQHNP